MNLDICCHSIDSDFPPGNQDNYLVLNLDNGDCFQFSEEESTPVSLEIESPVNDGILLAVATGCGGKFAGKEASRMVMNCVIEKMTDADNNPKKTSKDNWLLENFHSGIVAADEKILEKGKSDPFYFGMGSSFTGAVIKGDELHILHLGENRAYLIRDDEIHQITRDQSFLQILVDRGSLTVEDFRTNFIRMELWFILGSDQKFSRAVEASTLQLQDNDILLLGTPGLYESKFSAKENYALTDKEILESFLQNNQKMSGAVQLLIEKMSSKKERATATVILTRISGKDLPKSNNEEPLIEPVLLKPRV